MKVAIVGTGIAGNVVAYKLREHCDISVFEANNYVGGHTHTHEIEIEGSRYKVDTGFIVFNEWTYPNFKKLLDELKVEAQLSDMSFSVKCEKSGLEYNGTNLNSLFAQRKNLLRPSFYRMISDILRFNKEAKQFADVGDEKLTLGEFLYQNHYTKEFIEHYIIPMGSAIWSADPLQMFEFPACFFMRFFNNHGMLNIDERPNWYVVKGGSSAYVEKLIAGHKSRISMNAPVRKILRRSDHVELILQNGEKKIFDYVFLACHSDQALRLLERPIQAEKEVLSAIPYQRNSVVLHTDDSLLPRKRLAWAAWNYHILPQRTGRVAVTYNMNILQGIRAPQTFCVTLNNSDGVAPEKIIKTLEYDHPVFTLDGIAAQKRQKEINGAHRTFYCGAYWRNGFHEDGVVSALNAVEHFEEKVIHEKLHIRRAS